ncbi:hypothetical protein H9P43_009415 [Blastocladiella emersonii ATCC 22665]|nr:hypothetical protein H9P43_009415 [Blastocladiella emersonii ATCC 22665]
MLMQTPSTTPASLSAAVPACPSCHPHLATSRAAASACAACSSSTSTRVRHHTTHLPPTLVEFESCPLQVSVHAPATRFLRDLAPVFPTVDSANILVVPVLQPTVLDMVAYGRDVDAERDALLERFVRFASRLADRLTEKGYWCDFTDPASGYPVRSAAGSALYPDVSGCTALLRYDVMNVGCCKVVLHPDWGSKVYPATCFTTAPSEVVVAALLLDDDA